MSQPQPPSHHDIIANGNGSNGHNRSSSRSASPGAPPLLLPAILSDEWRKRSLVRREEMAEQRRAAAVRQSKLANGVASGSINGVPLSSLSSSRTANSKNAWSAAAKNVAAGTPIDVDALLAATTRNPRRTRPTSGHGSNNSAIMNDDDTDEIKRQVSQLRSTLAGETYDDNNDNHESKDSPSAAVTNTSKASSTNPSSVSSPSAAARSIRRASGVPILDLRVARASGIGGHAPPTPAASASHTHTKVSPRAPSGLTSPSQTTTRLDTATAVEAAAAAAAKSSRSMTLDDDMDTQRSSTTGGHGIDALASPRRRRQRLERQLKKNAAAEKEKKRIGVGIGATGKPRALADDDIDGAMGRIIGDVRSIIPHYMTHLDRNAPVIERGFRPARARDRAFQASQEPLSARSGHRFGQSPHHNNGSQSARGIHDSRGKLLRKDDDTDLDDRGTFRFGAKLSCAMPSLIHSFADDDDDDLSDSKDTKESRSATGSRAHYATVSTLFDQAKSHRHQSRSSMWYQSENSHPIIFEPRPPPSDDANMTSRTLIGERRRGTGGGAAVVIGGPVAAAAAARRMDPAGPVIWKSTQQLSSQSQRLLDDMSATNNGGGGSSLASLNDPLPISFPLAGPPRVAA